jgi:hypothetical protein
MMKSPTKQLFDIHVKREKRQSNQKWLKYELSKIQFKCGHSKYHHYLLVKVFIITFWINVFFFYHVSYIESM